MPKNASVPKNDQPAKFRELARELGCDESEERFDETLKKVAKHRPKAEESGPQQLDDAGPDRGT